MANQRGVDEWFDVRGRIALALLLICCAAETALFGYGAYWCWDGRTWWSAVSTLLAIYAIGYGALTYGLCAHCFYHRLFL